MIITRYKKGPLLRWHGGRGNFFPGFVGFHAWKSLFHPYFNHSNGRCPQGCLERSDLEDLLKDSVSVEGSEDVFGSFNLQW